MSAPPDWSVSQLTPLIDPLSQIITEPPDIRDMAERAGCRRKGHIRQRDTAEGQWQEVMRDAIDEGFLEELISQIQSKVTGKSEEDFRQCLQQVGARRLTELVGGDYAKLKKEMAALLEAEDIKKQFDATVTIRKIVVRLRQELDDNISWLALTPIETSREEIQARRDLLVVMCLNIVSASDYMLALIRPMCTPGAPSDHERARIYLAARRDTRNNASDDDEKLRRIVDARITLVIEVRRLWLALKDNVTVAPDG